MIYKAAGSHGEFEFNDEGTVLSFEPCNCEDCNGKGYGDIQRVDVKELREWYEKNGLLSELDENPDLLDVLELGVWIGGVYDPPSDDFRQNYLDSRKEAKSAT